MKTRYKSCLKFLYWDVQLTFIFIKHCLCYVQIIIRSEVFYNKKSYFMLSLNSTIFLFITALLALLLGFSAKFIIVSLSKSDVTLIQQISNIIKQINGYLIRISLLETAVKVLVITIELVKRFKSDKIMNYFKSVYITMLFRHFLTQAEQIEKLITIEAQISPHIILSFALSIVL
ncbi:hypothetical protein [Enterococcus sp. AZ109]|uniref:hypothetical protein n=1 Tax=Enterococcus sp. AZ109 TaxID=2774634 RepID=UPI003F23FFE7